MILQTNKDTKRLSSLYPDTVFNEYFPRKMINVTSKESKDEFKNNIFTFITSVLGNKVSIGNIDLLVKVQKYLNGVKNIPLKINTASPDELAIILMYTLLFHHDTAVYFEDFNENENDAIYKVEQLTERLLHHKNYDEERFQYLGAIITDFDRKDEFDKCIILESSCLNHYHNFTIVEIIEDMLQPIIKCDGCYNVTSLSPVLEIELDTSFITKKIPKNTLKTYSDFIKLHDDSIKDVAIVYKTNTV